MNMMHPPSTDFSQDREEAIDKRIIKEEYRNYDLVARYWEYGYLGKIWKHRKAVDEIDAEGDQGIDDLVRIMKERVDARIAEKEASRKGKAPTAAELAQALEVNLPRLSIIERGVLKLAASGEDGVLEVEAVQRATGYTSSAAVLMTFCNIAQRLCDELAWQPKEKGAAYPSLALLFRQVGKDPQVLNIKKDAQQALSQVSL